MIFHYLANILLLFDLDIKRLQRKREKMRALLYSGLTYIHQSKVKQRRKIYGCTYEWTEASEF